MVHSAPPTAAAARMAEGIVGELIGLNGIDLTLVGPLTQIGDSSTDSLTLESLVGDVAVLDWQSPLEIMAALNRIGFGGQRSPHQHDPEAPAMATNLRRVYALNLSKFSHPQEVLEALSRLNASRQIRTFSLGVAPDSSSPKPSPPDSRSSPQPPGISPNQQAMPGKDFGPPPLQRPLKDAATPSPRGETLNLDDLLDQLDQLDP